MVELGFYERALSVSSKGRSLLVRIVIVTAYILALIIWISSAYFGGVSPVIILLIALSMSGAAFFLLRRNDVEYEYTISESAVTLAKIYGKSKRKELFSADSDSIIYIAPYTETNIKKAESYRPAEAYNIYPAHTEMKLWILVFENEEEKNILFVFEAEDDAVKILRKLRPSAMTFM